MTEDRTKQALALGREHYDRHEYDRAEPFLAEVLTVESGYADVQNMMGVIHHQRGDFINGARFFERAIELNPTYTEALLNLAIAYNDLGKYEQAREVFARSSSAPKEGSARTVDAFALGKIANMHADVAQAYADLGKLDHAIEELRRGLTLRPEFADLRLKLAGFLRDAGRLEEAEVELTRVCDEKPEHTKARILLGVTLVSMKRPDDALVRFQEVLSIDPKHSSARMYVRLAERLKNRELDDDWA